MVGIYQYLLEFFPTLTKVLNKQKLLKYTNNFPKNILKFRGNRDKIIV